MCLVDSWETSRSVVGTIGVMCAFKWSNPGILADILSCECAVIFRIHDSPRAEFLTVRVVVVPVWMAVTSDRSDSHARGLVIC